MKIEKNSKGQFFSIITVLMILPLVALSVTFGEAMEGYGSDIGEQIRLKSSYYHYNSLERDLERTSKKIGERSLLSAISHVVENGEGLNSSSKALEELFVNGSINGEDHRLMNGTGIDYWMESIEEISSKRGYNVSLSWENPDVRMYSPKTVSFKFNYSLTVEESNGLFKLEKEDSKPNKASVLGFEDPLVVLGTGGRYATTFEMCDFEYATKQIASGTGNNSWASGKSVVITDGDNLGDVENPGDKILITNDSTTESSINNFAGAVTDFSVEDSTVDVPYVVDNDLDLQEIRDASRTVVDGNLSEAWEIENLYKMWSKTCYIPNKNAPDFLDRLENEPGRTSQNGLIVALNKGELEKEDVEVENRPNLAHIYFSEENVNDCKVKGMPESFKIDEEDSTNIVSETLKFDC